MVVTMVLPAAAGTTNGPNEFLSPNHTGKSSKFGAWGRDMSSDGRFVLMDSMARLINGDTNGQTDVYLYDHLDQGMTRVSTKSGGAQLKKDSWEGAVSDDGRTVVFLSDATTLVPEDRNGRTDIFAKDLSTGEVDRVTDQGGLGKNGAWPELSSNGRLVVFDSGSPHVLGEDARDKDVFVRDLDDQTITPVSITPEGKESNGRSFFSEISGNGRFVTFVSAASNLVSDDENGQQDVFLRDLKTSTTTRISSDEQGTTRTLPVISETGRYVAFMGSVGCGRFCNRGDVFIHDRVDQTTESVLEHMTEDPDDGYSRYSWPCSISDDGRYVLFLSGFTHLVPNDTNESVDVFVRDREMGETTRETLNNAGQQPKPDKTNTHCSGMSGDGRKMFLTTSARLTGDDENLEIDVYFRRRDP
jgi:Tol biopolymer transport system component